MSAINVGAEEINRIGDPVARRIIEQLVAELQGSGNTSIRAAQVPSTGLSLDASCVTSGVLDPGVVGYSSHFLLME